MNCKQPLSNRFSFPAVCPRNWLFDLVIPTQLKKCRAYLDVLAGFKPPFTTVVFLFCFVFLSLWFEDHFVGILFLFFFCFVFAHNKKSIMKHEWRKTDRHFGR